MLVLTLVSPSSEALFLSIDRCSQTDFGAGKPVWLSQGHACDLVSTLGNRDIVSERVWADDVFRDLPVDWSLQPEAGRRKRMLIADMDSTIIGQECLDELAALRGVKPEIAALTERAMRGELDFEAALHARIDLLKGITEDDIQQVLAKQITLNPGARILVQTMKTHGAHTILVSGGFTVFTAVIAQRAGFADHRANRFVWTDGVISGVDKPIVGREAKRETLLAECARLGLQPEDVIAVGDGANDLDMLKVAGLAVAYYAKPIVAAQADARVAHGDLTTLLYFQGYREDEFVP